MLHGPPKEKGSEQTASLNTPVSALSASRATSSSGSAATGAAEDQRSAAVPTKAEATLIPENAVTEELEKMLVAAREETAALRQELERVKQDAQASIEISKYQVAEAHQHTPPEAAMEVDNEALRYDHEREEDLANQNHNLRYCLAELQDRLMSQEQQDARPHPSGPLRSDADWDVLTLRLHESEKESHSRLQQLLSLKYSISSLTRTDSQVSDSDLAESFSQLANRMREWVVSNYRRTRISFNDIPEMFVKMLQSIKIDYKTIGGADKLALYQAITSRVLMQIFDEPLVVGMPDQGIYAGLRIFVGGTQRTGPEYLEWRRATLGLIESAPEAETVSWRNHELERLADQLEGIMSSISSTELTPSARSALLSIMSSAASLQRTLCLQKAEYRVVFFDTLAGRYHHFDDRAMEPINDLDDAMDESNEPDTRREFAFCVFPCLQKLGHDFDNVIFKARVCSGVG